jgi:hypothetical protein
VSWTAAKFYAALFGVAILGLEFAPGGITWHEAKLLVEMLGVSLGVYAVPNTLTRVPAFRRDPNR